MEDAEKVFKGIHPRVSERSFVYLRAFLMREEQYISISIVSTIETISWMKSFDVFLRQNVLLQDVLYQVEFDTDKKLKIDLLNEQVTIYFNL